MIVGSRLKQAREAKRFTQQELSDRVGLPQSVISRLELQNYQVPADSIKRIADVLEIPSEFLFAQPVELPDGSLGLFRSYSSKVSKVDYAQSRRYAELGIEALLKSAKQVGLPMNRISHLKGFKPEEAAVYARSMLRLPAEEPIKNLTAALERSGALVLMISGLNENISGFSSWVDPLPRLNNDERPLIVVRRPMTAFRLRFTLAHELGHLVLMHQVFSGPKQPVEKEANRFAQALLLPEDSAGEDLKVERLSLRRLAELKGKWGVSMHALAMRAKSLEIIDEPGYRRIYEALRANNYLKREPGDLTTACERPCLLVEILERAGIKANEYDVAAEFNFGLEDTRRILGKLESENESPFLNL